MKKQRLKKTQQENQVGEFSAMTSQVIKSPIASTLPHPPVMTSHIKILQKMAAEIDEQIVMTSQLQQSSNDDNFLERQEH